MSETAGGRLADIAPRALKPYSQQELKSVLSDFRDWGKGEPMPVRAYGSIEGSWTHGAGETCFARTIDPERYPPTSNTKPL